MKVKPFPQMRPKTTLFMISSLDGKISSGDTDLLDVDRDWKKVEGVGKGMGQYYQSGGKMNAQLVRDGLIDTISLVVAPLIVGGATTPTLVDGEALHHVRELDELAPLKLVKIEKLKHSFLHLVYKVIENRKV